MASKDKIGDRMKSFYESRSQTYLPRRTYTIIRLDGKAFHTFTKRFNKPFDDAFMDMMNECALRLCKEVQGCKLAYVQSDEISLVLTDFDKLETDAWFDNNVQKMCSVSASIFSAVFNTLYTEYRIEDRYNVEMGEVESVDKRFEFETLIYCDSRVFTIPTKEEVINYFIWRQQDATRNSISSVAHSLYSTKELHGKSSNEKQEMIFQKGINWDKLPIEQKRGRTVVKNVEDGGWVIDNKTPIFSKSKNYLIERIL